MTLRRKLIVMCVCMLVVPVALFLVVAVVSSTVYFLGHPEQGRFLSRIGESVEGAGGGAELIGMGVMWGVAALLISGITAAIVTLYLSRAILGPLDDLKRAARKIRDGNLDFEVLASRIAEIDELCTAFDDMRKRLKESVLQRAESERERAMLVANLSHDLRTPVTSIRGYIEGIFDGVANTPEKERLYLETIYSKAGVIGRLVDNMAEFSEMELGRMQFHFEILDYSAYLAETFGEYAAELEAGGAAFEAELPEEPLYVMLDRVKFRRVLQNIVSNAMKYRAERDPRVTARLTREEAGTLLVVSDNGRGIEQSELPRVFEGFYRADESRGGTVPGNGLGLAIARQIVGQHRGKIWLKSELGVGTSVHIYLPLRERPERIGGGISGEDSGH